MRVNVQLIDAANDKHLWAQIYDRELTDVFAIQTDLARAESLYDRAGLDRCEEAIVEGKRAVELLPESRDAFDGQILAVTRARISVHCRDYTTALDLLERSLGIPAGITVAELQRDPTWKPLSNEPRFKQMTARF